MKTVSVLMDKKGEFILNIETKLSRWKENIEELLQNPNGRSK